MWNFKAFMNYVEIVKKINIQSKVCKSDENYAKCPEQFPFMNGLAVGGLIQ